MPLVFNGFELGAVLLAILIANVVTRDGESNWFEGAQLLGALRDPRDRVLLRLGIAGTEVDLLLAARELRGHPRRSAAVHQRRRVGRVPARARGGGDRQPPRRGRHGDAGDADPDHRRASGRSEGSEDVAVGAIIGAPFLLATIAMALVGISALVVLVAAATAGHAAGRPTSQTLDRDLSSSWSSSPPGSRSASALPMALQVPIAVVFVVAYVVYVRRTLAHGGAVEEAEAIGPSDHGPQPPGRAAGGRTIVLQLLVGLGGDRRRRAPVRRGADHGRRGRSGSSRWCSRWCSRRWPPSCPRRRTASSGCARERTAWRSATSPARWSSSRTSRSPSGSPSPTGTSAPRRSLSGLLGLAGGVTAYWALRLRDRFEPLAIAIWICLFLAYVAYVVVA